MAFSPGWFHIRASRENSGSNSGYPRPRGGEQGGGGTIADGRPQMSYDTYDIAEIYDEARALLPATARLWQGSMRPLPSPKSSTGSFSLAWVARRVGVIGAGQFGSIFFKPGSAGPLCGFDRVDACSGEIASSLAPPQ